MTTTRDDDTAVRTQLAALTERVNSGLTSVRERVESKSSESLRRFERYASETTQRFTEHTAEDARRFDAIDAAMLRQSTEAKDDAKEISDRIEKLALANAGLFGKISGVVIAGTVFAPVLIWLIDHFVIGGGT